MRVSRWSGAGGCLAFALVAGAASVFASPFRRLLLVEASARVQVLGISVLIDLLDDRC